MAHSWHARPTHGMHSWHARPTHGMHSWHAWPTHGMHGPLMACREQCGRGIRQCGRGIRRQRNPVASAGSRRAAASLLLFN